MTRIFLQIGTATGLFNLERVVGTHHASRAPIGIIIDLLARRGEAAVEADAFLQIVVAPLPLIAGGLDGHVRA